MIQGLGALIYCGEHEIIPTKYVETDRYKRAIEYVDCRQYAAWKERILLFLERFLDMESPYLKSIDRMAIYHFSNVKTIISLLSDIKGKIADNSIAVCANACPDNIILLRSLLDRFHLAVSRAHLCSGSVAEEVRDEQKLLHTLLQLYFDNIRTAKRPPLYDDAALPYVLLPSERITVEMKTLQAESASDCFERDLAAAIEYHYSSSECDRLFYLLYDPGATIADPRGVEYDFCLRHGEFVEVIVSAPERAVWSE
jgi:hypothetical protein